MENNNIDKTFNEASKTLEEPATFPGFDKVWAKVEERLDKKEEKKSRLIPMWLPYGVAASLLIGSGIFYFNNKTENTEITTPAIVQHTIQPKIEENSISIPENIQKIDSTVKANIQSEVFAAPIPKIAYQAAPKMSIEAPQAAPVFEKAVETSNEAVAIMNSGRESMDTLKRKNIEEVIAMGIKKEKAYSMINEAVASSSRKKISELNAVADTAEVAYPTVFDDKGQLQEPEILTYNKDYIKKNPIAATSGYANRVGEKMAFNSLKGKVSGIDINSISGAPGSGNVVISLHCQGSAINSASPLYIVDGVVSDSEKLKKVDVKKIVAMNVFKGEKAVSLFGNKAANGVIVVETKDISKKEKRKLKRLLKNELPKK